MRTGRSLAVAAVLAAAVTAAACSSTSGPAPGTTSSAGTASSSAGSASSSAGTASSSAGSRSAPGRPVAPGPAAWTGYHANQSRTGAIASGPALDPARKAWSADLGGAVRGQPVVADGRVVAATENNRVVALNPDTGGVLWSRTVGPPLTNVDAVAGCGDIDPLGITSTPVIDTASHTVYVVAEVDDGHGVVHHQLEGLALTTGAVRISENVDPPLPAGERAVNLLQRASLALGSGRVYVSYGGNDGDCGEYHGWVVGVDETGPAHRVSFEVAADGQGGAIWASGGAPALDAHGNLYVTTGNANPDPPQGGPDPKQYTESVVELSPTLRPLASFKDRVAGGDEDLSTGNPVLLDNGDVFAVGKTDIGFVLRQGTLTQVAAIPRVCGSDPDGGPAYDAATKRIFVPCRDGGIQVVDLARNALGPKLAGADSAPIVIGSTLWALDHSAGTLTAFNAATGRSTQTVPVGASIPIFTSPSAGLGLLLVATTTGVTAFR
jgi:polyvinyl alcohol dehydrogenase (cytochrome)